MNGNNEDPDRPNQSGGQEDGPTGSAAIGPGAKPAGVDETRLVWVDMEMTGLRPEIDRIIEIAVVVTDGESQSGGRSAGARHSPAGRV